MAQSKDASSGNFAGFDRNEWPGEAALAVMRRHFDFVGYWLTNPPGETDNGWVGKRARLRELGFGFLVLANGRLDKEILKAAHSGKRSMAAKLQGEADAAVAVRAAGREGFPSGTILFLDQEEGGRLLEEQADYLLGWTEAVGRSRFMPGVYASGQAVAEEHGKTITTAQDIREQVAGRHLHEVALWVAQDACPPAPGCRLEPPAMEKSGTAGALVWQYAQSPRRPGITQTCRATYGRDGNCYVTGADAAAVRGVTLDLNVSSSRDPSAGR